MCIRSCKLVMCIVLAAASVRAFENLDNMVAAVSQPSGGGGFVRGDCNADTRIDIADPVYTLTYLFAGGQALCLDALDVNDDGKVDIADPIALLTHLFAGGAPPPAPFPDCGPDPTAGSLGCASFPPCAGTSDRFLVKLANRSTVAVPAPLLAVVHAIQPPGTTVINADGTYEGAPYFLYGNDLPAAMLGPGQETPERTWRFSAAATPITFQVRVLGQLGAGWLGGSDPVGAGMPPPKRQSTAMSLDGVAYTITTPGISFTLASDGKSVYHALSAPRAGRLALAGQPDIPGFSQMVLVPRGAQVVVRVDEGKGVTYEGIHAWPAQYSPDDNIEAREPPFVIDQVLYRTDRAYPESLATVREFEFRGSRLAHVQVALARINPAARQLTLYPSLKVEVTFEGGPVRKSIDDFMARIDRTLEAEAVLAVSALNYSVAAVSMRDIFHDRVLNWFYDVLVIADRTFEEQVERYAQWKRNRGLSTRVAYTDDIGATAAEIDAHVKREFAHRFAYLVLFGDAGFIPPHYRTRHPTGQSPRRIGTDLYYATMGGEDDIMPDVAIGRLPVNTIAEAERVVDKIIGYESSPTAAADFYQRAALAAFFQDDNDDGRADRGFAQTIERLFAFLQGLGRAPERAYETNSTDPRWWNDGSAIPAHLRMPGFAWDGDANDISAMINAGSFIAAHRDHGGRMSWSHPSYTTAHINALTNGTRLPVVFSINCQTGWFDMETDEEGAWTSGECFAEQFLLREGGGAVAVFAATRDSPSWPNNQLLLGMLDCVWPDMIPDYPGTLDAEAAELAGSRELGWILNYGKLRVLDQYPTTVDAGDNLDGILVHQRQVEIYHCLGDPTLRLRIVSPLLLEFAAPPLRAYANELRFSVSDRRLHKARWALVQSGAVIGQGTVTDGEAEIHLPPNTVLRPDADTTIAVDREGALPIRARAVFDHAGILYCLEAPVTTAGKNEIAEFGLRGDQPPLPLSTYACAGSGRQMTSDSGFTASARHLFAGGNASAQIEMFRFGPGGALIPAAVVETRGNRPASLAVDPAGEYLFASTSDALLETYHVEGNQLLFLSQTEVQGTARHVAACRFGDQVYVYLGLMSNPPAVIAYRLGKALEPIDTYDLTPLGANRAGFAMHISPDGFLYMLDIDAGVFAFRINQATGDLAIVKGSPFQAGEGLKTAMGLSGNGRFLYVARGASQNAAIACFAVRAADGAPIAIGHAASPGLTMSLAADRDDRVLYGALRDTNEIARWSIDAEGNLKPLDTYTVGDARATPAALLVR